jgi:hypothetical protein
MTLITIRASDGDSDETFLNDLGKPWSMGRDVPLGAEFFAGTEAGRLARARKICEISFDVTKRFG